MKRIIQGLTYNTESSDRIALIWNGLSTSDFKNYRKELHITKKQNLFFYESGGAMTDMAVCSGNMTSGSSEIEAISKEDAKKWYLENQSKIDIEIPEEEFFKILNIEEVLA